MKITFLGTGAADWPAEKTEKLTDFRRLSSLLIDGVLLIDPGPAVPAALGEFGKNPEKIRYIINTHRHSDHYSQETVDALTAQNARFFDLKSGDVKQIGGYTVRAYAGNHSTCENTVHFIITDGEKTLFYGLDGAWIMYDEAQAIIEFKPDFAVLDATIGWQDGDYRIFEHNNLNMVLEIKKTLDPYVGKFCISHMAYSLHSSHAVLSQQMEKYGVLVAADGLETEI